MTTADLVLGPVCSQDIRPLARVHRLAFPDFFLSRLGEPFLVQFYAGYLDDESAVTVVARTADGEVIGAAVGTTEPAAYFSRLLRRRWRKFGVAAARYVLQSPAAAPRLLRALRYRGEGSGDSWPGALLSSICVAPEHRQSGLGTQLLNEWIRKVERAGVNSAFLTTDAEDNQAVNQFYRRHGWSVADKFQTPEGRAMNLYSRSLGESCSRS